MDSKKSHILKILQSIDDPHEIERPISDSGLKGLDQMERLRSELAKSTGLDYEITTWVQDASFYGDIYILTKAQAFSRQKTAAFSFECDFAIRFSNFGNLVTVWENRLNIPGVEELLTSHGYVFIEREYLDENYNGMNAHFKGRTWWDRFFEYI